MKLKNLVESQQLDEELLLSLFRDANEIRENLVGHMHDLSGKILATIFYEPSTRTRLSFESAAIRLGGNIISTENAKEFSSAAKGESIEDTVRVISDYADCIVIRHHEEGSVKRASEACDRPVINAGDGKGQHPTQALLDVYTIYREFGRLKDLKIAFVGDLASGRTARSLCYLLAKFKNIEVTFVSPENLRMSEDIKAYLTKHNTTFREEDDLNSVMSKMDIIYMTRVQKERITFEDYEKARGKYVITESNLDLIRKDTRIMHPLPHVEEIKLPFEIEKTDERAAYFRQSGNGVYVRMALLNHLLR